MGQLGLEVTDRLLSFLEQLFRTLSCRDLLPQSLPRCVELVGAGSIIPVPLDDETGTGDMLTFSRAIKKSPCCSSHHWQRSPRHHLNNVIRYGESSIKEHQSQAA